MTSPRYMPLSVSATNVLPLSPRCVRVTSWEAANDFLRSFAVTWTSSSRMSSVISLAEAREITEDILDDEVHVTANDLKKSFAASQDVTRTHLGDKGRTFVADTESGIYRGEVIGETDHHVIQRL